MTEVHTLILGILHVFLKLSLKRKGETDNGRGRHGRPRKICVLWMEKGVGKDKEGYLEASSTCQSVGEKGQLELC